MSADVSACREKLRAAIDAAKTAEQTGAYRATLDPLHDAVAAAAADVLLAEAEIGAQKLLALRMRVAQFESVLLGMQKLMIPCSSEPSGFRTLQLPQSAVDALFYPCSEEFKRFELAARDEFKDFMINYLHELQENADVLSSACSQANNVEKNGSAIKEPSTEPASGSRASVLPHGFGNKAYTQ